MSRPRATLSAVPVRVLLLALALAALACFVVAAWGFDWRAGIATLGVALLLAEWRVAGDG